MTALLLVIGIVFVILGIITTSQFFAITVIALAIWLIGATRSGRWWW